MGRTCRTIFTRFECSFTREFKDKYRKIPRDVGFLRNCSGQVYQAMTYLLFGAFVMGVHRYARAPWVDLVAKVTGLSGWALSLCHLVLSMCCGRCRADSPRSSRRKGSP